MPNKLTSPEIKKLTGEDEDIFQALALMGNATSKLSWANNYLEDLESVPEELKKEIINKFSEIHDLMEKLREIRGGLKKKVEDYVNGI